MESLKKISKETLVILVSHNTRIVDEYCERKLVLENGRLISDNPGKLRANPQRIEHKRRGEKGWLFRLLSEDYRQIG
jgi:ABC-type polysaccharide/polyol phosphate transport system ATPase subunit